MIRKNRKKIKKAIMDGLHDVEETFDLCDELKALGGDDDECDWYQNIFK